MPSTEQVSATPVNVAAPAPPAPIINEVSEFYLALKNAPTDEHTERADRCLSMINVLLKNGGESPINHLNKVANMRAIDIIPCIWDDDTLMALLGLNITEMRRAKGAIKTAYETICALAGLCGSGKHIGTTIVHVSGMYGPNVEIKGEPYVVNGNLQHFMNPTDEDEGEMEDGDEQEYRDDYEDHREDT